MRLVLQREASSEQCTHGQMFLFGVHECYTLEDPVRPDPNPATPENEAKIPGQTAIPAGTYKVIVNDSPHFGRKLPLLLDVPGYVGVRIHPGNTAADTRGCILPGSARVEGQVTGSKMAFEKLFTRICSALTEGEEVWIEVRDA